MFVHHQTGGAARRASRHIAIGFVAALVTLCGRHAGAQSPAPSSIDSLVTAAMATNPRIRAADARIAAAVARVGPAGLRPDPMLMAGIQNLPALEPGFGDFMTMKMVGITQTIPLGGKLEAARSLAQAEVEVARESRRSASLDLGRDVRLAAYDIAYADRALAIIEQSRATLANMLAAAEIRFGTGGGQAASFWARGSSRWVLA
jgi:cobalt-zinc-cadmium efflux system outer membrane protein